MPDALVLLVLSITCIAGQCPAAEEQTLPARGHRQAGPAGTFNVSVPQHPFDLILARPEKQSITLSILAYGDMEACVDYGTRTGTYTHHAPPQTLHQGKPLELVLHDLAPDTAYYYQFQWRGPGAYLWNKGSEYSFHTARPAGGTFTFTMTADAHLDEHTSAAVYKQTLANILTDRPDFHIDLGNLFMTDKHATRDEAAQQYLAQRYYLGQIGSCVPIFLGLGTHDGEGARYMDGSEDCLAVWSNRIREQYFANPVPDAFYSGDHTLQAHGGLPQDYYAWEWGDALFVVLDPFRCSARHSNDGWGWSLGRIQYDWLAQTLMGSRANYKFVIIHNLLSGNQASRGGVEIAGYNEWGGKNLDGTDGFAQHRPGWPMPVHQMLVQNHVTAVFKAHDNFYARQQLDGIVYLMVPQPSFAGEDHIRDLDSYGYKHGTFLGSPGYVRVIVSPQETTLEYAKSSGDAGVADRYRIPAH